MSFIYNLKILEIFLKLIKENTGFQTLLKTFIMSKNTAEVFIISYICIYFCTVLCTYLIIACLFLNVIWCSGICRCPCSMGLILFSNNFLGLFMKQATDLLGGMILPILDPFHVFEHRIICPTFIE